MQLRALSLEPYKATGPPLYDENVWTHLGCCFQSHIARPAFLPWNANCTAQTAKDFLFVNMRMPQWVPRSRKKADASPNTETSDPAAPTRNQLPMLHLADTARNNLVAGVGEFVGTFLFLFFSFAGTQVANTPKPADGALPNTSNLLYSALCFGFSLMVNVWAFYRVTGGLFNPAVCSIIPTHNLAQGLGDRVNQGELR